MLKESPSFAPLNKRAEKFDLCALFKALDHQKVDLDKLLFEGTQEQTSSTRLCQEITPSKDSVTSAIVKLNLGLLTASSPLPSYYRKGLDKGEINENSFIPFIQFFNHHVIKNTLRHSWIERFFIRDWETMKLDSLSMMGLDSVSSLHWLFSLYFPELELTVSKSFKEQRMSCPEFNLGISRLGEKYALGGYVRRKRRGYNVSFRSDIAQTETRVFWPTEIRNRLRERIFPLLEKTHIFLIVTFSIDQYKRATYLNTQSFLGFTSLGETSSNFNWSLYEGSVSDNSI